MRQLIKHISATLSAICFILMIGGIETNLWRGLLVIPFGVFMYLGGGCYECFYPNKNKKAVNRK